MTLNRYTYANNNPLAYWDGDGRMANVLLADGEYAVGAAGRNQSYQKEKAQEKASASKSLKTKSGGSSGSSRSTISSTTASDAADDTVAAQSVANDPFADRPGWMTRAGDTDQYLEAYMWAVTTGRAALADDHSAQKTDWFSRLSRTLDSLATDGLQVLGLSPTTSSIGRGRHGRTGVFEELAGTRAVKMAGRAAVVGDPLEVAAAIGDVAGTGVAAYAATGDAGYATRSSLYAAGKNASEIVLGDAIGGGAAVILGVGCAMVGSPVLGAACAVAGQIAGDLFGSELAGSAYTSLVPEPRPPTER